MPRNYYILSDDRGWHAVSNGPFIPDHGSSYRTFSEAMDHVRELIAGEGLVMGRSFYEGGGTRVEAIEPGDRPMLYSPESMRAVEFIKDRLDRSLKRRALDLARREGRNLITDEDIWEALEGIDVAGVSNIVGEGAGDE